MKKISILSLVCMLAACGGGSGGSSTSYHKIDVVRAGTAGTVTEGAAESNSVLTSMVSEIGVATDGSTVNIGRSPFTYNGKTYDSYKLDNVKFASADEGFGGEFQFVIDETTGEITHLYMLPDEEDDPEDEGMIFERVDYNPENKDASKQFTGQVNHNGLQDAVLTYNSLGSKMGLRYSDFGGIDIDVLDGWRPVFMGGYDVKKIEHEDIADDATFNGKATGSVIAIHNGEGTGEGLTLDADAKLTFNKNTGASELTAKFANWYDVKYTESGDDKTMVLNHYKGADDAFRMLSDTGNGVTLDNSVSQYEYNYQDVPNGATIEQINENSNNKEAIDRINSDIRYYGDNNVPYESVGIVQVRDCAGGVCGDVAVGFSDDPEDPLTMHRNDEVRMNLGFGAKR